MVQISLKEISVAGELRYFVDFPRQEIGGYSNPKETEVVFEAPRKTVEPLVSLLELDLMGENFSRDRWRLWFNNIAIAREIKPVVVEPLATGKKYIKALFDITPLIEGKEFDEYRFRIRYLHSESMEIVKLGFLLVYREEGSSTELGYSLTPSILSGDEAVVEAPVIPPYTLRITGILEQPSGLLLDCGGGETVEDYLVDAKVSCKDRKIRLTLNGMESRAIISSIIAYRMERPEPSIDIRVDRQATTLNIEIENTGTATAENVIVLVLAAGTVLHRSKHETLHPGSSLSIKVDYKKNVHTTIRVITKYKGETRVYEKKLKPEKNH